MSDYIKREDAIAEFINNGSATVYGIDRCKAIISRLQLVPSADVVEVVRCKDCKYAEVADPEDSQDGYICQFHRGCIWFSGSYCSWGERADT